MSSERSAKRSATQATRLPPGPRSLREIIRVIAERRANPLELYLRLARQYGPIFRLQFPGREVLFILVLGTMMIPDQLRLVPVYQIMKYAGLTSGVNTYGGFWGIVPE